VRRGARRGGSAALDVGRLQRGAPGKPLINPRNAAAALDVISSIEAERNELDYDLDGAVLRLAARDAFTAPGTRANSSHGALAFKFAAEERRQGGR
jgi:DNA ligase (NAD+)